MNDRSLLLVTVAATTLLTSIAAGAQTNVDVLRQLSLERNAELERRRTPLFDELRNSSDPIMLPLNTTSGMQLMYIRDTGMPVYYATLTLTAAQSIRTDEVWPGGTAGLSLDGSGTTVELGIWDGGDICDHETMTGRIVDQDGFSGLNFHATWVAGILIAAPGFNADVQGMCYAATTLQSYDAANDEAEMALAAANGMLASNHSYEIPGGWRFIQGIWYWFGDLDVDPSEDYGFGFYGPTAQAWDQIAFNAPNYFIQKGCGNDRFDGPAPGTQHAHFDNQLQAYVWATDTHDLDGDPNGYDCVSWFGNAKNIVSVGAVEDIPLGYTQPSDVVATSFTSYGPCDDGRIKPDVVANGADVVMPDCSGFSAYDVKSGTSLAGPCVTGSANLLRQHYEAILGTTPRAATLKAIILQTADESGDHPGPDYRFGWGLMNTAAAAAHITAGSARSAEETLVDGDSHGYRFTLPSSGDLKFTIVWTDPPGTVPTPSIDPTDRALVNDLDLRVVHLPSLKTYEPWVLDGANPTQAATTGDNVVDNVEQVCIANAPSGDYRVKVSHKGTLTFGVQAYSLVSSVDLSDVATALETDTAPTPHGLALHTFPNPFNPATTISYTLRQAAPARLSVFNVEGALVRVLVDAPIAAGTHQVRWDGTDDKGATIASGTYFVELRTGDERQTQRVVLLK